MNQMVFKEWEEAKKEELKSIKTKKKVWELVDYLKEESPELTNESLRRN